MSMPNPKSYKDEKSWMSACMSKAKKEGRPHDQGVAMCLSMWRRKDEEEEEDKDKTILDELEPYMGIGQF
jgi:hypothetical protein